MITSTSETIRASKGKVLVEVNLAQKDDFAVKTKGGLSLFMRRKYGFDGKISNPVLAKVISVHPSTNMKEIFPGDFILCHHNTFAMKMNEKEDLSGDSGIKTPDGNSIFSITPNWIYCKVDKETAEPIPITGMLIVSRITKPAFVSKFFVCPDSLTDVLSAAFVVDQVGYGCDGIKPGDGIITFKYSDVDMSYNLLDKDHTFVRVWYTDVQATFNQDIIPLLSNSLTEKAKVNAD